VACPHDIYGYAGVDKHVDVETVRRLTLLRRHILKSGGHTAQSMQRGAHYLLVLTSMLRTSDANRVSYSPTRALFVMLAGLINIELLGLQDGYIVEETMNVNYEWEAAVNESAVEGQGDGAVTCNC
jgi:hypothetical protein